MTRNDLPVSCSFHPKIGLASLPPSIRNTNGQMINPAGWCSGTCAIGCPIRIPQDLCTAIDTDGRSMNTDWNAAEKCRRMVLLDPWTVISLSRKVWGFCSSFLEHTGNKNRRGFPDDDDLIVLLIWEWNFIPTVSCTNFVERKKERCRVTKTKTHRRDI